MRKMIALAVCVAAASGSIGAAPPATTLEVAGLSQPGFKIILLQSFYDTLFPFKTQWHIYFSGKNFSYIKDSLYAVTLLIALYFKRLK